MPRLLISNHTPTEQGGVYLLETGNGRLTRVCKQPARGLTRGPDAFYFVEIDGRIFRLDPDGWTVRQVAETGLRGCHDLKWLNGEFYLVASIGNRVARLNSDFQVRDVLQVIEDESDVCHANCLEWVNGEMLLSVFTLSPGRREEKRKSRRWRREGKVLRLDWERKGYEILFEPLSQPHSLTWHQSRLFCCESFNSDIVILENGDRQPMGRLFGFVRGLDFGEGTAYVGISHHRVRGKTFLGRLLHRLRSWCGVVELDTRTWKVRRRFRIPGRELYDVLVLPDGVSRADAV